MRIKPLLFFAIVLISACTKKADTSALLTPEQSWQRGKAIYISNCASCHNVDPKIDGAVGPAVFAAGKELIEARIMKGEYPAGYTAKRSTKSMVAMPHLKNEMSHIIEFLSRDKANQ